MTDTLFVALIAMMVAILAATGVAVMIVAAQAGWRVCKRDWSAQAIDNTRNSA
jgi:hypothetical protein